MLPSLVLDSQADSPPRLLLQGDWSIHALSLGTPREAAKRIRNLEADISRYMRFIPAVSTISGIDNPWNERASIHWDLSSVSSLDQVGALLLWRAWGRAFPPRCSLTSEQKLIFSRLSLRPDLPNLNLRMGYRDRLVSLGMVVGGIFQQVSDFIALLGQSSLDLGYVLRHPDRTPWREISANLYRAGVQALGITALVGFLIGMVLSYLTVQQLQRFGASIFIVNLMGVAILRELGPVLAAILVAGRSGSAMTASLGVMRVTEELDALLVMGIPWGLRLVFPKIIALMVALPLLFVWTSALALLGGQVAANVTADIGIVFFWNTLFSSVSIINLWVGGIKSLIFGLLIALISCHFGMRIRPNTESLGKGTTQAVVSSITAVIVADAGLAIVFSSWGIR